MVKWQDIIGEKFGILTVKEYIPGINRKGQNEVKPKCVCVCECGRERIVMATHLRSGHTRGCGFCLKKGLQHKKTHNQSKSLTYKSWVSMKTRCHNPEAKNYSEYGGAGIVVCEKWLFSFQNFLSDMGERPTAKHTIDRYPNMKGIYELGNCRWATPKEQQQNRRNTYFVIYEGEKIALSELSDRFNANHSRVLARVQRGWDVKKALTHPLVSSGYTAKSNFIPHSFGVINSIVIQQTLNHQP